MYVTILIHYLPLRSLLESHYSENNPYLILEGVSFRVFDAAHQGSTCQMLKS
jgi:hypothetical protein